MKKIFTLLAASLLAFASCDKIESDNYLRFAGQSGTWYDGNGVENPQQRVFLEKYTGVKCVNCPTADEVITASLEKYDGQLIAVAIHDSSNFSIPYPNNPDLRSEAGNQWSRYFGIRASGSYPAAMINRPKNGDGYEIIDPGAGVDAHIERYINNTPTVGIEVASSWENGMALIDVDIEYLTDVDAEQTLTVFIMEDGIVAKQKLPEGDPDPNYVQNHVLRTVITDIWGDEVKADGKAGTQRTVRYTYSPNIEWVAANCHVVAIISDKESKTVINVAECKLQ